jgi:hypothetical protein
MKLWIWYNRGSFVIKNILKIFVKFIICGILLIIGGVLVVLYFGLQAAIGIFLICAGTGLLLKDEW